MDNHIRTNPENQNNELGKVSWYRDYDYALLQSEKYNKPILLFFQEIPGCATCVNFGREVLSHPLMVEAIENEFIPLAIYNNKAGKDAIILAKYDETSWNNPVAHFVNKDGLDIIEKLSNNYHPLAMLDKMIEALAVLNKELPDYIVLFQKELKIEYGLVDETIYETPCFWSGETTFAQHDAVFATLPGFIGNREVVKINYDANLISLAALNNFALEQGFFLIEEHFKFKIDKDPHYYLKKTKYKYLPLTSTQKTAINFAIPYKKDPDRHLSPKQLNWLKHKKLSELSHPKAYELNIIQSWHFLDNQL